MNDVLPTITDKSKLYTFVLISQQLFGEYTQIDGMDGNKLTCNGSDDAVGISHVTVSRQTVRQYLDKDRDDGKTAREPKTVAASACDEAATPPILYIYSSSCFHIPVINSHRRRRVVRNRTLTEINLDSRVFSS